MPRFFVQSSQISGEYDRKTITITGDDARHIGRSLRMRPGEQIVVCDMAKREYDCVIAEITADTVTAQVTDEHMSLTEPGFEAVLYQALPKGDKMDTIVQKAVECGVSRIVPVLTANCVSRPDAASMEKKIVRWQRIADEAAKQCGRGIMPKVCGKMDYAAAVSAAAEAAVPLFCYEGDGTVPLREALRRHDFAVPEADFTVSVVIGPEGGFSMDEVKAAEDAGMLKIGLGHRILRTETASSVALACLCYEFEK